MLRRKDPVLGSIPSRLRPGLCWPFGPVLLVLLVLLSGPGSAAAQPCAEGDPAVDNRGAELAADCTTLLGLKDELRGTAVLNWARDVAMDDWDGLTVAGTPARVTKLELGERPLTGTLPTALNSLTGLTVLNLQDNQLTGSIPDLSALTRLRWFFLDTNQLTGSIPALSALTSLTQLDLSDNQLRGSIPALSTLTSLGYLALNDNQLTGSIPALSALTRLTELYLADNQLTGPLPDLSALTSLAHLDLGTNRLTGSIPDLSALTSLTELYLSDNQLTGSIPPWLNSLTSLERLYLFNNRLTGSIPDLSALTRLTWLGLGGNQLTGSIPPWLNSLTSLRRLGLAGNQLTGSIPDLSALTRLERLYLSFNQLTGSIPPWLNSLTSLTRLSLSKNQLTGPLPDLSALTRLTELYLSRNDLTGSIPAWLNRLTSLTRLYLFSNQLTDPLPDLSALTRLEQLDLSRNDLTGSIPAWLNRLTSLTTLNLYTNQLTGPLPDLSALTRLEHLDLNDNDLTGPLPAWLNRLTSLTHLDLRRNQLTGPLPALPALTSLEHLDLSDNRLTGGLPLSLRNRPGLRLYLRGNPSDFRTLGLPITTTADTLTAAFATFDPTTAACGTIVDLAAFPTSPTLREALIYANQAAEPVTIVFTLPAGDRTITLADPLPTLCGGHLTLDGDIDADGSPDITLDGTGLPPDADGLTIASAHNTLTGLTLTNMPDGGIVVFHTTAFGRPVTNNTITHNTITGSAYGIAVQAGALDGRTAGAVSATTVRGNTITGTSRVGIAVLTFAPGSTLTTTRVEQNEVHTSTGVAGIAAWSQSINTRRTDSITALTIVENHVHDHTAGIGIGVTSGFCGGHNNRMAAVITGNTLAANGHVGHQFPDIAATAGSNSQAAGCTTSPPSATAHNHLDVTITDNHSEEAPYIGIAVTGGFERSDDNTVTATVARNAVWRSGTAGLTVTGGMQSAARNTVTATLHDNLLARATALPAGTAGYGLHLRAAAAVPPASTSHHNTLTVSGRGNVIALARTATDTAPDLLRQQNNGSPRTGNRLHDSLAGTFFTTEDNDGTPDAPLAEVTPFVPVRIPAAHPEVAAATFTPAASTAVSAEAGLPAHTQLSAGGHLFDITLEDSNGGVVEGPLSVPVQVCLPIPVGVSSSRAYVLRYNDADPDNPVWERLTSGRRLQNGQVCADVSEFSLFTVGHDRPATTGGGGRGGSRPPADQHGDAPATATTLDPTARAAGYLQSGADRDYFHLALPSAGILRATTTGHTDTQGQLWQERAGELVLVAEAAAGGARSNFQLGTAVAAGPYYLAVSAGATGTAGAYTLDLVYSPGYFENPGATSFQSGIGVISGWVCAADTVTIEFERPSGSVWRVPAAAGTLRPDTATVCGHAESGFGLLWNWNKLGPGAHTVRAVVDDVVLAEHAITVTTLGLGEFPTGLSGEYELADFPAAGETTQLQWSQAQQNFVIVSGAGGGEGWHRARDHAVLGNPQAGSLQSGIGVISGWACAADVVEIVFENETTGEQTTVAAGYGTLRPDTERVCGDTDNGFGLLWNWNTLGDGRHTVRALADGEEFAWSTVTVTTLGEEFVRGLAGEYELEDFPTEGQMVTVEWQEAVQNFVITDRE